MSKLLDKLNPLPRISRLIYRGIDTWHEAREKQGLPESIAEVKEHNLQIELTGPPQAGINELVDQALRNGILQDRQRVSSGHQGTIARRLILTQDNPAPDICSKFEKLQVLMLPPVKQYTKTLKAAWDIDSEKAMQAYDLMSQQADNFDIILNEGEAPAQALATLCYKIRSLLKLRQIRQSHLNTDSQGLTCFVIWGHGLKYQQAITDLIAQDFEILTSSTQKISHLKKFIRDMYIEEVMHVGHHIIKKNKHLARCTRQAMLVLARQNNSGEFSCTGHGPDQRICTTLAEHCKQVIRDQYNPKKPSGRRSERHVIHGTDIPYQIEHILNVFELNLLKEWKE